MKGQADRELYLCNPLKNRECRKDRCVFDGRRRYDLRKGCYQTTDRRFAVLDGAGNPLTVEQGISDYLELLKIMRAKCGLPPRQ